MGLLLSTQNTVQNKIKQLLPKRLEAGAEIIAASVVTVASSSILISGLHKLQAWSAGSVKLLSRSGFEIIKSVKAGGMLGVASIVDSIFGIIIRKVCEQSWVPSLLGLRKSPYIPQWQSHQEIYLDSKPVKQKIEVHIPHWLRIAQRAAALGVTCLIFTAIIGPQPLLYGCAVMDLTWFIFNGLKAGITAPCEHKGAIYILGQALMCTSPEIYMICAAIAGVSYLIYLVAEDRFQKDSYFEIKDGKVTDKKIKIPRSHAKHLPIGITKIDKKAKMRFAGEDITLDLDRSKKALERQIQNYQHQLATIDSSNLLFKNEQEYQTAHQELKAALQADRFLYREKYYVKSWTTKEALIETLEKNKPQLEKQLPEFKKSIAENQKILIDPAISITTFKKAKNALVKNKNMNHAVETELACINDLLEELNSKSFDKVRADYQAIIKKSETLCKIYPEWVAFKDQNNKKPQSEQKRVHAIKLYLNTKIEILKLKILKRIVIEENNKDDTVYWNALYQGRKVILREDQLYAIPVETNEFKIAEEYKRQQKSKKFSVIKDFPGTAVNTFLSLVSGMDFTSLIGGGGLVSQIATALAYGSFEFLKLFSKDSNVLKTLGPLKGLIPSDDDDKDPTGNANEKYQLTPTKCALTSAQVNRCAQVIDDYQEWYNKEAFVLPGDTTVQNMGPIYNGKDKFVMYEDKETKKDPKTGKSIPFDRPHIGHVNRALINELGIQGANDEKKFTKLQQVIEITTRGENFEQRKARLTKKEAALKEAKTEDAKKEIEKKYKAPEGTWKSRIDHMKCKTDLITPCPGKVSPLSPKEIEDVKKSLDEKCREDETIERLDLVWVLTNESKIESKNNQDIYIELLEAINKKALEQAQTPSKKQKLEKKFNERLAKNSVETLLKNLDSDTLLPKGWKMHPITKIQYEKDKKNGLTAIVLNKYIGPFRDFTSSLQAPPKSEKDKKEAGG